MLSLLRSSQPEIPSERELTCIVPLGWMPEKMTRFEGPAAGGGVVDVDVESGRERNRHRDAPLVRRVDEQGDCASTVQSDLDMPRKGF